MPPKVVSFKCLNIHPWCLHWNNILFRQSIMRALKLARILLYISKSNVPVYWASQDNFQLMQIGEAPLNIPIVQISWTSAPVALSKQTICKEEHTATFKVYILLFINQPLVQKLSTYIFCLLNFILHLGDTDFVYM